MAAHLQRRGFASVGKRFAQRNWISTFQDDPAPLSAFRRATHVSVYDKNVDDQVRPSTVPDDVIEPHINKYWTPHPQTGVFGPTEHSDTAHRDHQPHTADGGSVLEQKAWFRPLEDVDKPTTTLE